MWIVKGTLLGIVFFIVGIVGVLSYIYIRIKVGMYLYAHHRPGSLPYYSFSTDDPRFWIPFLAAFLAAIAIGLWIMRPRTRTA